MVDLMGRLSNPPATLESVPDQEEHGAPPHGRTRSKSPKRHSAPPGSAIPEEKGRLSNPVLRRLSAEEIDELARLYREGATIVELGRRCGVHRTTVTHHLDRQNVSSRSAKRPPAPRPPEDDRIPGRPGVETLLRRAVDRRCRFRIRRSREDARPGVSPGWHCHPTPAGLGQLNPPGPFLSPAFAQCVVNPALRIAAKCAVSNSWQSMTCRLAYVPLIRRCCVAASRRGGGQDRSRCS